MLDYSMTIGGVDLKQEYGIIERGIYLAEIRKRQVTLMPLSEKQKANATAPKHFGMM